MNWVDTLNSLIEYVENNLDDEISSRKVELITGCQYSLFLRMFSYIADVSLHDYIRRRKLSIAAAELQTSSIKVVDLAVKYGYESADAFTTAFKKQHGVTPSQARNRNIKLSSYPRLTFSMNIVGGTAMNYKLVDKCEQKVIGVYGDVNKGLWDQVKKDGTLMELEGFNSNVISLGLCFGYDEQGNNKYMVAVDAPEDCEIKDKYVSYVVPATSWLVFESVGPVYPTLQDTWKRIYGEFLLSSNFKQNPDIPTIEKYFSNDTDSADYKVEVWIPILH